MTKAVLSCSLLRRQATELLFDRNDFFIQLIMFLGMLLYPLWLSDHFSLKVLFELFDLGAEIVCVGVIDIECKVVAIFAHLLSEFHQLSIVPVKGLLYPVNFALKVRSRH